MEPTINKKFDRRLAAGIILIIIGITVLLQRWVDLGMYMVLLLGGAMLAWGSISRRTGWIIPGGVLGGIGLGMLVLQGPWTIPVAVQGGVFLICFACGWFIITLLTALFSACTQWWALIPGGIMAVIGGSILVTRGNVRWEDLNFLYAGLLIFVGVILLVYRGRSRKSE